MRSMTVELVELEDSSTWLRHQSVMLRVHDIDQIWDLVDVRLPEAPRKTVREKAPPRVSAPVERAPASDAPVAGQGIRTDPAKVAEARRMFETSGDKLVVIAERTGIKYQTLFAISQREKWQRS